MAKAQWIIEDDRDFQILRWNGDRFVTRREACRGYASKSSAFRALRKLHGRQLVYGQSRLVEVRPVEASLLGVES